MPKLGLIYEEPKPTNFKFTQYVSSTMVVPDVPEDYSLALPLPPDSLGNSKVGNCVDASGGHYFEQISARSGCLIKPTSTGVIADYSEFTGYDPLRPETDRGGQLSAFMTRLRTSGMIVQMVTRTVTENGVKVTKTFPQRLGIDGYVEVNAKDLGRLKAACYLSGGLLLATALPNKMVSGASLYGAVWDTNSTFVDGGIKGYHAILGAYAHDKGIKVNSWGGYKLMTEAYLTRYCYTAFAPISFSWMDKHGTAANNFDIARLRAELAKLAK